MNPGLRTPAPIRSLGGPAAPQVTARPAAVQEVANVVPLPAQVHLGHRQQDQDGRVRRAGARPATRQRLLRAGVQRPGVRGAVGPVGFKLLRCARGEKPVKAHCAPQPQIHTLPSTCPPQESKQLYFWKPSCLQ